MLKSMTFRSTLAAVAWAISFSVFAMANGPTQVDIPAGNLVPALEALEKQAAIELVFQPEQLKSFRTKGVKGTYELKDAVRLLLKGTPLELRTDPSGAMVIVPSHTAFNRAQALSQAAGENGQAADSRSNLQLAQATPGASVSSSTSEGKKSEQTSEEAGLQEIVVTGRYEFLSVDTSGATNLPLPIERVPQSISLVSNDFIEAADLKTLGQIAEYTPGAINVGNPEGYGSVIQLRGFTAGQSVDGLSVYSGGFVYEPDYAIFDRLELVKGPSSVVYGISTPGGLVNFVTKSATPQTPDYLYAQVGSWNNYRVEGQAAGSLDAEGHVRAIGVVVQDQGDSFLNEIYHKKTSLYGGVNVDLGESITAYLHGGYERFERTSFDGTPLEPDGSAPPIPRSLCLCSEQIVTTSYVYHAEGDLTWHATDMLDISVKGNYEKTRDSGTIDWSQVLTPSGDVQIGAASFDNRGEGNNTNNYVIGLSSIYRFDGIGFKNSFISLAAAYQYNRVNADALYAALGTTNIFDGQAPISQAFAALLAGPSFPFVTQSTTKMLLVSEQSVFKLSDPLTLLFGASYSKPDITEVTDGAAANFNISGQVSYRAGLTYEFVPRANAYFSYSQSFVPQNQYAVGYSVLPPLKGDQYEVGLKYRTVNGRMLLTGAVYQIKESNVAEFDTFDPTTGIDFYKPIGEVKHRGFEIQSLGAMTSQWQINAGYAYLDPKITGAIASQAATVGQTQLYLPEQTFSLYTTYTMARGLLRGLSFGGGIRYVTAQRTSYESQAANVVSGLTPTKDLPGYPLVDVTASYPLGKWAVQLNVHNLFDRRYFINNYQSLLFGNLPGDPTNFALSVRRTF